MPLERYPASTAFANHKNRTAYWPYAADLMRSGTVVPRTKPRFTIDAGDRLFAMGSCFARRIEEAFVRRDFPCISQQRYQDAARAFDFPVSVQYGNKYSTHAMLNELTWALDPSLPFPHEALVDQPDGTSLDLQATPYIGGAPPPAAHDEVYHRHMKLLHEVTRGAAEADVVVLTLGLVEVWHDLKTGLYCNVNPMPGDARKEPERFTFEVSTFDENMANMERIHALLARFAKPTQRIVVTTSPVPMAGTFSTRDVTVANSYSKGVLRAVAEEWSVRHENVDYFPSYEMATISSREVVWDPDLIHVSDAFADVIVGKFIEAYCPKPAP